MIKNILATILADERYMRTDRFERNAVRSVTGGKPAPALTFTAEVRR